MTHTTLFKNEIYLTVTSIISIGVLSGNEYFELALAVLLIAPVVNFPVVNIFSKEKTHPSNLDKCATCK